MLITTKSSLTQPASSDQIIETILASRGLATQAEQSNFLKPHPLDLEYLYSQSGVSKVTLSRAQSLLDQHLKLASDIVIFGDYDADGVTATAVLYRGLSDYIKKQGSSSRLLPFIPDRRLHGYGLSTKAVEEVSSGSAFKDSSYPDFKPKLVITVDTGIVAHAGITTLVQAEIDVVITDHHMPESTLPAASVIIHSTITSGAGVAWIFVSHLLSNANSYLDLATIGIIADMMPLVGFNRNLVMHGLKILSESNNIGYQSLRARMGIPNRAVTTYDISFGIAPRINAAGRIYSPLDALRLLCTNDPVVATNLSNQIESHNSERQLLTETATIDALNSPLTHKIITICGDYHEGVIGLVAGKLVEKNYRPAIVMSDSGDVIKGSARSVAGFNITNFLRNLKIPFLGLGGHEAAAGFSIAKENLEEFIKEVNTTGDQLVGDQLLVRQESADLELPLSSATLELAKKLSLLEPYGLGNSKPKFLFKNVKVIEDRALGELGKHHKLTIEQGGVRMPLLMFNTKQAHPINYLSQFIATIDVNVWNNKESVQLVSTYVET